MHVFSLSRSLNITKPLWCLFLLAPIVSAQSPGDIAPKDFERLHADIRPRAGESPWAQIPWTYDLVKARKKAAEEGKPLCIWRMAGDPTAVC
jgi:hypothetical protein